MMRVRNRLGFRAGVFVAVLMACGVSVFLTTFLLAALVRNTLLQPQVLHVVQLLEDVPDARVQEESDSLLRGLGVRVIVQDHGHLVARTLLDTSGPPTPTWALDRGTRHYVVRPPPPASFDRAALGALVAVILTSLLAAAVVARIVTRPVTALRDAAQEIGLGNFSVAIETQGTDEISQLGTSLQQMSTKVQRMVRVEKAVTASVSHELRTPMSRIRMALELVEEGDDARARVALLGIRADLDELDRVLADLVDSARLEVGSETLPVRKEQVDLRALVESAMARSVGSLAQLKSGPAVHAHCDATLVRRAVENLLGNAAKHGCPPIEVRVEAEGHLARVEVVDRGEAIALTPDLERLFEPFVQRQTHVEGLGLGLTLARAVANAHGGDVSLRAADHGGLSATIHLPVLAGPLRETEAN